MPGVPFCEGSDVPFTAAAGIRPLREIRRRKRVSNCFSFYLPVSSRTDCRSRHICHAFCHTPARFSTIFAPAASRLFGADIDRMMAAWDCSFCCGCGGTGRRPGFRFRCRKAWGFESLHPHQLFPIELEHRAHKPAAIIRARSYKVDRSVSLPTRKLSQTHALFRTITRKYAQFDRYPGSKRHGAT